MNMAQRGLWDVLLGVLVSTSAGTLIEFDNQHASHSLARPAGDSDRYYLNKADLASIYSIECLRFKQTHPDRPCMPKDKSAGTYPPGTLSIGNYPNYQNQICHSNHEYFCDPRHALTTKETDKVTHRLQEFRERTLVNCGQLKEMLDPDVERRWFEKKYQSFEGRLGLEDYREFNLAIALADEWNSNEMDPKSMEYFGRYLMTDWGLMPIYNGVDNENGVTQVRQLANDASNCPNTAVIFIMPRQQKAWLMSPSCEFLCESRGGPEVIEAVLAGLARGGLEAAIMDGIEQVAKVLDVTIPASTLTARTQKRWNRPDPMNSDTAWVWAMRSAMILSILAFVSISIAFIYFQCTPDKTPVRGYRLMREDDFKLAVQREQFFAQDVA